MRIGDKSSSVRLLQQLLNEAGAKPQLEADGWFGEKTKQAVIQYQLAQGITAIGIAGPRTMASLQGKKQPGALSKADLEGAASALGVEVAAIAAIADVESAGSGFFANNKAAILFERHIFYRQVAAECKHKADALHDSYPNICNPRPGGYVGGLAEYQRLAQAKLFNSEAAHAACSYGMFQIMGFHAQALGHDTAEAFAGAMNKSEGNQLAALVAFINTNPALKDALLAHNWPEFARIYNGPNYEINSYDTKLQQAYNHFSGVYKTPVKAAKPAKRKPTKRKAAKTA